MQNQNYTAFGAPDAAGASGMSGILFSSAWVPREVRCRHCAAAAAMQSMDCVSDAEIAVSYACPDCGWQSTQHFHEETPSRQGARISP